MAKHNYFVTDRCTRSCSFYPENLPFAEETLKWYNEGKSVNWMMAESERLGRKLSGGGISRHRRHLAEQDDTLIPAGNDGNVDHLQVLQQMIAAGAKRAHTWRIGPAETLKAMQMYYQLTQGSAMQSLFERLTAVAATGNLEEGEEIDEFDAGSLSPAEMESLDADSD